MADDAAQIGVTITGTAAGINAASQQASASIKQLETELRSLQNYAGQGVKGLDAEIAKVSTQLDAARNSAREATAAVAAFSASATTGGAAAATAIGGVATASEQAAQRLSRYTQEMAGDIERVSRSLLTAGGAQFTERSGGLASAIISQASVSQAAARLAELQQEGERAAHGITTAMDAAFLAPSAISAAQRAFSQVQERGERAARGISTAMNAAFVAPSALQAAQRGFSQIQEQGERAAHGFTTAMNAAFVTPSALQSAQTGIAKFIKEAEEAQGGLKLMTAGTTREFIVLGHEALTGNFSRIPGSMMVLAERAGSLNTVIQGLVGPWGAVGLAGVGALVAIGYAAYQAYEGIRAVKDTAANIGMQGLGDQTAQLTAWRDQLTNGPFNESGSGARKVIDAFKELPAELAPLRGEFYQLAEALAQIQHTGSDKTAEQIARAFEHGGSAALTWADRLANVRNMTTATGLTVGQLVTAFDAAGNKAEAARVLLDALAQRGITEVGTTAKTAENEVKNLMTTISQMDFAVPIANLEELGRAQERLKTVVTTGYAVAEPPAITLARGTAQSATPEAERRIELQQKLNNLKAVEGALQGQLDQAIGSGTQADFANAQAALQQNQNAQSNIQIELVKTKGAAETEAHEQFRQQSEERLRIFRNDAAVRLDTLQRAAAEAAQYAPGTAQAAEAQAKVTEELQRQKREEVQAEIEKQRDIAAAAHAGTGERVAAAEAVRQRTGERGPSGEPLFNPAEQASAARAVTAARRAEEDQQYRDFKAAKEREIQENKGALDRINADYAAISARAVATHQPASELEGIARAQVRAQQEAQREQFRAVEESLSAENRIANAQLGVKKAQLGAEVAAHAIAKSDELAQELAFSAASMAQQENRAAAALNQIQGSNQEALRERERLNEQLAGLYAKDAENQAQIQKQITSAIDSENKKRAENFTSFFNSAGDGISRYLTAAVTGSTTRGQAGQQLVTGLIGDVTKSVTGIGSRFLGGQAASAFGIKAPENAGLGDVLGLAVEKALGLYKEPPKGTNEHIGDLLATSKSYYDKSLGLLDQISKNTGHGAAPTGGISGNAAAATSTEARIQAASVYGGTGVGSPRDGYPFPNRGANSRFPALPANTTNFSEPHGPGWSGSGGTGPDISNIPAPRGGEPAWATQLSQSTKQLSQTQQQAVTTQQNANQAVSQNAQSLTQDNQAMQQHSASAEHASTSVGGAGGGGLVGGVQQLTGSLGAVSPELRAFSGILGIGQSVMSAFNTIVSATTATTAIKAIVGFAGGTRSTPEGPILVGEHGPEIISQPGGMAIMPASQTRDMMRSMQPGSMSLAAYRPSFQTLAGPSQVSTNSGNNTMTYAPNITGRFGGMSRQDVQNILRSHGDAFEGYARNAIRNARF